MAGGRRCPMCGRTGQRREVRDEKVMENRSAFIASAMYRAALTPVDALERNACIAVPILGNGDVSGCVVALFNEKNEYPSQAEIKLAEVAAQFLGKQTEE